MPTDKNKLTKRGVQIAKLSPQKLYNYIKAIEIDGLPRIRAYAETIDPAIYDMAPVDAVRKLDYIKESRKDYNDIRDEVLAERAEWNLRRSAALQNKALDLLSNLMDKANEIAKDPAADAKELNTAINTLKTIMPAFQATTAPRTEEGGTNKKLRAGKFIC